MERRRAISRQGPLLDQLGQGGAVCSVVGRHSLRHHSRGCAALENSPWSREHDLRGAYSVEAKRSGGICPRPISTERARGTSRGRLAQPLSERTPAPAWIDERL